MKIVLASRNRKKINELKNLLSKTLGEVEILSLDDVGITEEIEENGATFEENALIKARVAASSGYIGVGDDSGLTVDALGGDPGIYSARYAARCQYAGDHDDEGNNQALLHNLEKVPDEKRGGTYRIDPQQDGRNGKGRHRDLDPSGAEYPRQVYRCGRKAGRYAGI